MISINKFLVTLYLSTYIEPTQHIQAGTVIKHDRACYRKKPMMGTRGPVTAVVDYCPITTSPKVFYSTYTRAICQQLKFS